MAFKPTAKQEEATALIAGPARHILLEGGSRSGKTFLAVWAIVLRALIAPGSRHLIVRFRFNHVITSIWHDTFPKVMASCFPGVTYTQNKTSYFVTLPGGSEIWFGGLDDKERTEKVLGNEYCLDPASKVLKADLTWGRADSLMVGEELIGFPENIDGHIILKRSTVERTGLINAEKYRIITDRGKTVVSAEHKFVEYRDDRRHRNFRSLSWSTAKNLKVGDRIKFAAAPWDVDSSHDSGWLAGVLDGEGWISKGGTNCGVAQNPGLVLDKLKNLYERFSVAYRQHVQRGTKCNSLNALGMWSALRLIGITRPIRLMQKSSWLWENRRGFTAKGDLTHLATINEIHALGVGPVVSLGTSTKTLIADGFLGHNSTIYPNEASQIPYRSIQTVRTRLAQRVEYKDASTGETRVMRLKMLYDENPPSKGHWTYKEFHLKQNPEDGRPLSNPENYAHILLNPTDNVDNIAPEYLEELRNSSERVKRRFLYGMFADDNPNALFPEDTIDKWRVLDGRLPEMVRLVIAVDPSGAGDTDNADNDAIGICAVGLGTDGNAYLMEDLTVKAGPATWGRIAVSAYDRLMASLIVGEKNFGGEMVRFTIQTAAANLGIRQPPFKFVTATRGKTVRAEPIAALYEQGKVRHVGYSRELEDELLGFGTNGYTGDKSPNRADALIWALTELFAGIVKQEDGPITGSVHSGYSQRMGFAR